MTRFKMCGEPVFGGHTPSTWSKLAGEIVAPMDYVDITGVDLVDPDSESGHEFILIQEEAFLALNNQNLSPRYRRLLRKWYRNDMIVTNTTPGEGVCHQRINQIINVALSQIRHPAWNTIPNPFWTPTELPKHKEKPHEPAPRTDPRHPRRG